MLDLPENCLELLADSETLEDRRRIAEVCLRHIAQYFDRYDYLAHRADRAMQCAPSVHSNFAEKAFEMEKHVRVISKLALDTLNDLRDSGALQRIYGQAVDEARSNPSFFRAALEAAKADLQKLCPTVRKNVLDEAFGIAQAFTVNVHAHYPRLVLSVTGFDREERHVVIDATPGPGKPGRVDTRNFFSSASTMPVGSRPLPIVEKSQNKAQQQRGKETEEDLYAGIISGLALGRELAYRHAREVERLGVPALQGSEGLGAFLFIAALILSAVIGAGLFIDGVSHGRALEAIIGSILIGGVASVFGLAGSDWNQPPAHVVEISVGP